MIRNIEVLCTFIAYIGFFWRTFKTNPGNKLVECGSMTLIAFFLLIPLTQIGEAPDWLFLSWVILVVMLCLATLFFVAQRGYRALHHRQKR